MDATAPSPMRRSYRRRSADERVAEIQARIDELKNKQVTQEKKHDPVLREIQKLQRRLKGFVQLALDHNRPDVANGALGFKSMLERILTSELGSAHDSEEPEEAQVDEE